MNILLWALQVALALLCIAGGTFKVFKIEQLQKGVASMRALPRCPLGVPGGLRVPSRLVPDCARGD